MFQERTLTAAASSHDDKDIPAIDRKGKVALHHKAAIRHGQILNGYVRLYIIHKTKLLGDISIPVYRVPYTSPVKSQAH